MSSSRRDAEVLGITPSGGFRDAPVRAGFRVERPQPHHLRRPDLDVDLHVDSILHPEK